MDTGHPRNALKLWAKFVFAGMQFFPHSRKNNIFHIFKVFLGLKTSLNTILGCVVFCSTLHFCLSVCCPSDSRGQTHILPFHPQVELPKETHIHKKRRGKAKQGKNSSWLADQVFASKHLGAGCACLTLTFKGAPSSSHMETHFCASETRWDFTSCPGRNHLKEMQLGLFSSEILWELWD